MLTIIAFRESWDQFIWPLTVISGRPSCGPIRWDWCIFNEDYGTPPTEQMAIAVLATIPVFLLFVLLQRGLRSGFGLSGLKG